MNLCEHKNCGSRDKVWLPYYYDGRERGLKQHPYCVECGLIKSVSSDRPRAIGFYMNSLANLGKLYRISQVQIRLVVQEMDRLDFEDGYGLSRVQQETLFIEIIKKFINLPEGVISKCLKD